MDANNVLSELERAMGLLQSGWRIYVIEDKPYPVPHRVVLVKDYHQEEIGYNTFVSLVTQQRIRQIGETSISGMPAEEWTMVG